MSAVAENIIGAVECDRCERLRCVRKFQAVCIVEVAIDQIPRGAVDTDRRRTAASRKLSPPSTTFILS